MRHENPALEIRHLVAGARAATGLTVIIDVLRAFSVACYAFANGAARIIPVADVAAAFALRRENPAYLLMGERGGIKIEGFDFGNSPSEIQPVDLNGRTLVHTTSNGTQGLVNARRADEVITGSFVNTSAVVDYIRQRAPQRVTLVAMGSNGREAVEDRLCAEYIHALVNGLEPDFAPIEHAIRTSDHVAPFLDPHVLELLAADVDLCLKRDSFPFVLRARPDTAGLLALTPYQV